MTYRQAGVIIVRHLLVPALFAIVVCASLAGAAQHPAVDIGERPPTFASATP